MGEDPSSSLDIRFGLGCKLCFCLEIFELFSHLLHMGSPNYNLNVPKGHAEPRWFYNLLSPYPIKVLHIFSLQMEWQVEGELIHIISCVNTYWDIYGISRAYKLVQPELFPELLLCRKQKQDWVHGICFVKKTLAGYIFLNLILFSW